MNRAAVVHVPVRVPRHSSKRDIRQPADDEFGRGRCAGTDFFVIPLRAKIEQLFGEAFAARVIGRAGGRIIIFPRAERNPKREPSPRQGVDAGRGLAQNRCIPQGADHDHRRQPDAVRDRGGGREGGEGIVTVIHHPIQHRHAGKRAFVRAANPVEEGVPFEVGDRVGEAKADVHLVLTFTNGVPEDRHTK